MNPSIHINFLLAESGNAKGICNEAIDFRLNKLDLFSLLSHLLELQNLAAELERLGE